VPKFQDGSIGRPWHLSARVARVEPMTDISTEAPHTGPSSVLTFLAHRWPTWCGLAAMTVSVLDMDDGRGQGLIVFLAALIYLAAAVVGRPGVVWPLFGVSVVAVTLLRLLDVHLWTALVAGAVAIAIVGLAGGVLRGPRLSAAQVPAMLVFGGAVIVALSLDPVLGGYLVAAALVGHAVLDVIVWRAREVVTRSLAEFCAVLDLTLGIAIIVLQVT
jgi:signal transduction histidine kinase